MTPLTSLLTSNKTANVGCSHATLRLSQRSVNGLTPQLHW